MGDTAFWAMRMISVCPCTLAAAGGEGEGSSLTEGSDAELLADDGTAGDYEAAVDAVLAGIA